MAQPYLHDHVTCVAAPATWLSPASGQLTGGADGLYVEDRRVLSRLVVEADADIVPVAVRRLGAASAHFAAVLRDAPTPTEDPTVTLSRHRLTEPMGGTETITLANAAPEPVTLVVTVHAATDFAGLGTVRAARTTPTPAAAPPSAAATTPPPAPAPSSAATEIAPAAPPSPPTDAEPSALSSAAADAASSASSSAAKDAEPPTPSPAAASAAPALWSAATDGPPSASAGTATAAFATAATVAKAATIAPATTAMADAIVPPDTEPRDHLDWRSDDGMSVRIQMTPPAHVDPRAEAGHAAVTLSWRITVPPRGTWSAELRITRTDRPPIARPRRFSTLRVAADDRRLDALVRVGVQDLDALRRTEGADAYYAAGSPWYLTLFGRDALWTARLALPLGTDVAAGTLRALGARQGREHDPATEEEPGRILHEVRPPNTGHGLPPIYYGTVDATPLFVSTLADAYRWGMPAASARALLPNVRRAMGWLVGHEGFVAHRTDGPGLRNQGWKDSSDAIQHADGRPAAGPVALSEVQAYAYRAALDAAWLLERFPDEPDAAEEAKRWREWAHDLAERFRAAFWCPEGHPAIALDGAGERVDLVASNMGHLLGTGVLAPAESAAVAGRLAELRSPFGIRTASPRSAGYNFLSYHLGSVWPHDNAITLLGLVRDGHRAEASAVITALLDAAERFEYRLPELYGGDDLPTPYPSACRPQAWAAAAAPAILTALLGLDVDVPAGRITFAPLAPSPVGAFRVRGLKIADGELDATVTAAGELTVHNGPLGVTFHNADGSPARIARPA